MTAVDLPPLECANCGLPCWNDESVRWLNDTIYDTVIKPYCVENGCAAQAMRMYVATVEDD